jgi:hypothetical protein
VEEQKLNKELLMVQKELLLEVLKEVKFLEDYLGLD